MTALFFKKPYKSVAKSERKQIWTEMQNCTADLMCQVFSRACVPKFSHQYLRIHGAIQV